MKIRTYTVTEVHPLNRVVMVDADGRSFDFYCPGLTVGSHVTIQTDRRVDHG